MNRIHAILEVRQSEATRDLIAMMHAYCMSV